MENIRRLQTRLCEMKLPALLVSDIDNVQWLTGFTGTSGYAMITQQGGGFFTDSRYTLQATEEIQGLPVIEYASQASLIECMKQVLADQHVEEIAFEAGSVSFATYANWLERFSPIDLKPAEDFITSLKMIKSNQEIDWIKEACAISDACFESVQRLLQPGVTEFDIGLEIEFFIRRQGADLAFPPSVVSGERSAKPHGKPTERKLSSGDFVTLDFGARVNGYCSDVTRTVILDPASTRHCEVYEQVLKAQMAALEAMKPGVVAKEVDSVARQVLEERGLSRYFRHGLGHGLGRNLHDGGKLSPSSDTVLEEGQVWTVEPGVYIEGFGGVRVEDDVLVSADGVEVLTQAPKQLMVLPA